LKGVPKHGVSAIAGRRKPAAILASRVGATPGWRRVLVVVNLDIESA
jgi:hypothetical protein